MAKKKDISLKDYRQRFICKKTCIFRCRQWYEGEPLISKPGEDVPHHFEWVADIDKPIEDDATIDYVAAREAELKDMKKDDLIALLGLKRSRLSKELLVKDVLHQEFGA